MYQRMTILTQRQQQPSLTWIHNQLGRKLVQLGIYPAVDPLASSSRALALKSLEKSTMQLLTEVKTRYFNVIHEIARYHCYPWYG